MPIEGGFRIVARPFRQVDIHEATVRSVSKIDIPSGQQDSLEAFNRHVPQRGAYRMTLSPDGKKAQWFEGGPGSPARQWRVVSLDGISDIVGKWDGYLVQHSP